MKQTNKLEAVPAHRERRADKSLRTLAQMRTACILHSQFGMTRFIGLHRPTSLPLSSPASVCMRVPRPAPLALPISANV